MRLLPPSAGAYSSQTFFCHLWRSIVILLLSVASDSCVDVLAKTPCVYQVQELRYLKLKLKHMWPEILIPCDFENYSETHVTWSTYPMRLWKLSMRLGPNFKELKFMDITTIPPIHLSSRSYGSTSKTNLDFEMELFFSRPLLCKGHLYKSRCLSVCLCVCARHF